MTRLLLALAAASALASCGGGGSRTTTSGYNQPVLFATGPISSACLGLSTAAASRARCGCVQAVANMSLDPSEQRRGAVFFRNPAEAQDVRQSDKPSDERFWLKWKDFGDRSESLCRNT